MATDGTHTRARVAPPLAKVFAPLTEDAFNQMDIAIFASVPSKGETQTRAACAVRGAFAAMDIDVTGLDGPSWDEPMPDALDAIYLRNLTVALNASCLVLALQQWSTRDIGCTIFSLETVFKFLSTPVALSWPSWSFSSPF